MTDLPKCGGVGAVLAINGETEVVKRFMKQLPAEYGKPVARTDLHVTLVDWDETMVDVSSDQDIIALNQAKHDMVRYLGHLPLGEIVVNPEENRLEPFGRFLGIPIKESSFIEDARGELREKAKTYLGITLSDDEYRPHMSVLYRRNRRIVPKSYQPPFPDRFHVIGFDVGQRTFVEAVPCARRK